MKNILRQKQIAKEHQRMKKQPTTIVIEGLSMTELRQQQVGQGLKIALAQQLDGEIDDVTIAFKTES